MLTAGERIAAPRPVRRTRRLVRGRLRTRPISRLTLRILAINVLAFAILVGGVLYLGHYQDNLVQTQLDAVKAEARLFAGIVAEGGVMRDADERYALSPRLARQVVRRWVEITQVRTRVYDSQGAPVADSNQMVVPGGAVIDVEPLPPPRQFRSMFDRWRERIGGWLDSWPGRIQLPVYHDDAAAPVPSNPDLGVALDGDPSARVWLDSAGNLVITAAAPVQRYKRVLGAVVLNHDGSTIESAIRSTRFDIIKASGGVLAITILLSLYLASAIGRPIRRLALAAEKLRTGAGKGAEIPDFTARHDEIGELSRALRDMTAALRSRMDATERFAADVAHELKNPLTSLASAVETVGRVKEPAQQERLLGIIREDVTRLDRLISDISNASRLDAELARAEAQPVDLGTLLGTLAEIHRTTVENRADVEPVQIALDLPRGLVVRGIESRLGQVFQNLITNAVSFSPPGAIVGVAARTASGMAIVSVEDQGPGIPAGKLEAIFDRFYSERPAGEAFGTHSGLGLSIAKQIVEALGGRIYAENRIDTEGRVAGARFTVELPLA